MTPNKLKEVATKYNNYLIRYFDNRPISNELYHCIFMTTKIIEFVNNQEIEKGMRWLGFIQGVFWVKGIYSIEQMREHNKE